MKTARFMKTLRNAQAVLPQPQVLTTVHLSSLAPKSVTAVQAYILPWELWRLFTSATQQDADKKC